jgi:hypothetical protein
LRGYAILVMLIGATCYAYLVSATAHAHVHMLQSWRLGKAMGGVCLLPSSQSPVKKLIRTPYMLACNCCECSEQVGAVMNIAVSMADKERGRRSRLRAINALMEDIQVSKVKRCCCFSRSNVLSGGFVVTVHARSLVQLHCTMSRVHDTCNQYFVCAMQCGIPHHVHT